MRAERVDTAGNSSSFSEQPRSKTEKQFMRLGNLVRGTLWVKSMCRMQEAALSVNHN
jgi:hypothetical protein